jgi:hypothetical protein
MEVYASFKIFIYQENSDKNLFVYFIFQINLKDDINIMKKIMIDLYKSI